MRDHNAVAFENFNGWYKRGDADSTPPGFFVEAINIDYIDSGFKTRDGIEPWVPDIATGTRHVMRIYEFSTDAHHGLLVLNTSGSIYYIIPDTNTAHLVLTIPGMTDFSYVSINNFAYIGPSVIDQNEGMTGEFLYVYDGTSTPARKAAGDAPADADGAMAAANSATAGNVEFGLHIFGVVYETDSGFLTQIGPDTLPTVTADGTHKVDLSAICVSPSTVVVARHIVASKAIDPTTYTGDTRGYELFFVPDGTISDNTTTVLTVNFFDIELLESAAYLFDIMQEIPAPGGLATYHNRLVAYCFPTPDYSLTYLSQPGEPEAISALDGLITLPRDTKGITCAMEYRDLLYLFKIDETRSFADNGDVPSSWTEVIVDNQIGCSKHGMARRGEETAINVENLFLFSLQGIFVFNGTYQRPEFSFNIEDFWIDEANATDIAFRSECHNDVKNQIIYISIPQAFIVLVGNYKNGFTFGDVRWSKWTFNVEPTTMTMFSTENELTLEVLVASNGNTDGTI